MFCCFFFQAEDGIRDLYVTGVQTCALPISKPEFTTKFFYGQLVENTPERHFWTAPDGTVLGDSPTIEFDPPRRLVHGWSSAYDEEMAAEPESRVTWEIEPRENGVCLLTVVHDRLD